VGKKRRGMLAFYITTGVVVALLAAGYFAWTPLRVSYAMRRAGSFRVEPGLESSTPADKWLMECVDAACNGHGPAMKLVMDKYQARVSGNTSVRPSTDHPTEVSEISVAYLPAIARTEEFFSLLAKRTEPDTVSILYELRDSAQRMEQGTVIREAGLAYLERDLVQFSKSKNSQVSAVAAGALKCLREKFKTELARARRETPL
jgi:hypothetical protein